MASYPVYAYILASGYIWRISPQMYAVNIILTFNDFLLICSSQLYVQCQYASCVPVRINKFFILFFLWIHWNFNSNDVLDCLYVKNKQLFLSCAFFCYIFCHNTYDFVVLKKRQYVNAYFLIDKDIRFHSVLVFYSSFHYYCLSIYCSFSSNKKWMHFYI